MAEKNIAVRTAQDTHSSYAKLQVASSLAILLYTVFFQSSTKSLPNDYVYPDIKPGM